MDNPHLTFHHFGLAVKRPAEAVALVSSLGYTVGPTVLDPLQNVHLALCAHVSAPAVEIIWPANSGGPVDKLAQRHSSGIIYHLCYETDNLAAALSRLEQAGLKAVCISSPTPAPLFDGRKVSFYNVVGIGLVEILE
ncbi:MAG TPA: VOC family protein [Chthoniobacteraceae bacterium]|nr:VOC family protein [Chthoniobacteraceae bacterium]